MPSEYLSAVQKVREAEEVVKGYRDTISQVLEALMRPSSPLVFEFDHIRTGHPIRQMNELPAGYMAMPGTKWPSVDELEDALVALHVAQHEARSRYQGLEASGMTEGLQKPLW